MDRLHQQPLFTILGHRRRFPMESSILNLLQCNRFSFVKFFRCFCVKSNELSIRIFDSGSIIQDTLFHDGAILRNYCLPFGQFRHLLRIISSAVPLFYQTIMISTRIRTGSHSSSARFTISCVLFCWLCSVGAFCDILLKAR